jgi:outer membrane protein assembly factor BamB
MKSFFFLAVIVFITVSCSHLRPYIPQGEQAPPKYMTPVWIKNLDPLYDTGNLPISLQSPLIHDDIVYAGHNQGKMEAFELENGRLIWSEKDGSSYHAGAISYNDQIVYGTTQGRVISRHAIMGTIKYSVDLGAAIETKGVVHNGRIFFQLRNHQVLCLDVETGKILWGYKRSVASLTTLQRASTPIVYKDKVLVGFADGTFAALSIDEGNLIYETKLSNGSKFVDVDNTPFVFEDKIYIAPVASVLSVIDPLTGKVIKQTDFSTSRAPFVRGNDLVFGGLNGEVILTDRNLNVQMTKTVTKGAITNMVDYKNHIAISSTSGEIVLLDKKTLEVVETFKLGHSYSAVFGEMISTGKNLVFISSRNRLYLIK